MMQNEPARRPSSADSERVPTARITFQLDQHTAAGLAGKIAPHWGTVDGDWTPGNGLLASDLFHLPLALLAEEPPDTCAHAAHVEDPAERHWWPELDPNILCTDPCLYGPSGLWFGLRAAVADGIIPLACDSCAQPIQDRLLHLLHPTPAVTLHAIACAGCIEAAAPAGVLP